MTDSSLFIYKKDSVFLYVLVYVDDIIVTGNYQSQIDWLVSKLGLDFSLKDLGPLHHFLGIEVLSHGHDIILSQQQYIMDILSRAGLSNAKPASSPMSSTTSLTRESGTLLDDPTKYRQIVGALQYVTLSRPDIAYTVNKVCQFMHAPTDIHWTAVKRILRYLCGTTGFGLLIRRNSNLALHVFSDSTINAYSDSDWVGRPDERRSTGGFAIFLGSSLISWCSRKQRTVSRSSTESEYKALADTAAELTWLQALLGELGVKLSVPPTLWCDNLGVTP